MLGLAYGWTARDYREQEVAALTDRLSQLEASNAGLAEKVAQRPDRLSGLAALPMHDPEVAAEELHRAVADDGIG